MDDLNRSRSRSRPDGRRLPSYFDLIEDEMHRRGGGGGGAKKTPLSAKTGLPSTRHAGAATAVSRAAGNNAVVVKVLSYGAGASSARNVLAYQSKEEKAHDQDGREVTDLNAALRSWEREFGNRKGSKDILRLTYELENTDRETVARALGSLAEEGFRDAGDTDRTYAFSVSEGVKGQTRLHFALVIAHEKKDRSDRSSRNRIAAEIDDVHAIDVRLDKALRGEGITPVSRYPAEFSSGPKGLTATLHAMQRAGAEVTLSTKAHIAERFGKSGRYQHGAERREITTSDHKQLTAEGKIVGALMQTRQPRDFMHLLLSGPANVDRDRFILAGRDFLKEQFAGHRYAYAIHNRNDLEKHPHLHVIVALRNGSGKMLNPNIRDFTEWRTRFAEIARERGIAIDRQKRIDRAGPPPIKRWEWEMFHRMGATAPPNVVEKVMSKLRDTPTAPRLEEARKRLDQSRHSVGRVIEMLEGIAKDRSAPSTARELSHDLSIGLQREYRRLEIAVSEGRDPTREKGEEHMLRSTPISTAQAKAAKETLATTALSVAAKIVNPTDRLLFEQATKIIGKVVGLQLDSRVAKNRDRAEAGKGNRMSDGLATKSATGRDHIAEQGVVNKTSNNRSADQSRIARSNAELDRLETERPGRDRQKVPQRDREISKSIKLRPPQEKDRDRSR
ncbi:relaxase/mobilization nuclease domain-containing protein [Rhizobium lentis]|uniref:relaxase/mobilization nuclease domain-containing protein n=1 Tax=Rhizobium lentis TaxID=1138194 RepID=UPI001C83F4C8|nr:relaxase/mobilization nuclease domain-containing protein [Rhizobium lentis]MBX4893758.1 relaxase/mobilization nuclease domain-containing protein [Rhizobium bangladeshense]MBX5014408.1 relaxase/mobilization nuclease domain-containing protein [Rhizobium lentis]